MKLAEGWDKGDAKGKNVLAAYGVTKDDAALTKAMDAFMDKSGNIDAVSARLKQLGIDDAQIQKIVATTEFSRNVNDQGGFRDNGGGAKAEEVAGRAGRQTAFEKAVKEDRVKGSMADLVRRQQKGEKLSDEEKKALKDFYSSEDKFDAGLKKEDSGKAGDASSEITRTQIKKEAQALTDKATSAADPTGIGAAVSSAIGPAIADAFKTAISELAKLAGPGKELVVTGSLSLVGLDKVIADLTGKPQVEATPAGPPTVAPGNSRFGATQM
jgi:hypothetical protein